MFTREQQQEVIDCFLASLGEAGTAEDTEESMADWEVVEMINSSAAAVGGGGRCYYEELVKTILSEAAAVDGDGQANHEEVVKMILSKAGGAVNGEGRFD